MSKNYEEYQLEDFIVDEFFVHWVKHGSPESAFFWEEWLKTHPEKAKMVLEARRFIASVDYQSKVLPSEEEFLEVLENIHKQTTSVQVKHTWTSIRWISHAASVVVFIGLYWFWFLWSGGTDAPQVVEVTATEEISMIAKENPPGQKSVLTLEDGTVVSLNAASSLHLPASFATHSREVFLTGEAFFEVAEDTARPFIIHTGPIRTTVLGTSFNVQAYPGDDKVEVVVVSGKVAVRKPASVNSIDEVLLMPNDRVVASTNKQEQTLQRNIDTSQYIAWKRGVLVYKDATFEQLKKDIERWYGVRLIPAKGLGLNGRYDGYFDNKSLESVLEGLSFLMDISYTIEGKNVFMTKK